MGRFADLVRLAANQGGFVNREQLLAAGMSSSAIGRRVANGEMTVVADGVYQIFPPSSHMDLLRGAVVALPDPVVSHQSAAHLLRLPRLPELVPTVTVASHTTHQFLDVTVRRMDDLTEDHLTTVEDLPVTNVARTVFDLGAVIRYRTFEDIAEAAILAQRMEVEDLANLIDQLGRRGKTGTKAARDFVTSRAGVDRRSTRLEVMGRRLLEEAGLPPTRSEYPIPWRPDRRFDDAYPEAKSAIEWDSRLWHAQMEAMRADRQRDREAAAHGWVVLRFTWHDVLDTPGEVVGAVRTLLEQRWTA